MAEQRTGVPTKSGYLVVRVTPRVKLHLLTAAADAGESLSDYVRGAVYARLPAHLQPETLAVRE